VDEGGTILAGHGRWLAAKELGLEATPVIVLFGLSDAQKRAYLIADNKLAEKAGWDRGTLALELSSLSPILEEAGLDIALTGFEPAEIDGLLSDLVEEEVDPADEPPLLEAELVSQPGDLWLVGSHRLLCGDARYDAHFKNSRRRSRGHGLC
jgi:ParB-like chromosome segregation protein Spo0J